MFEDNKFSLPLGNIAQQMEGQYTFTAPSDVKLIGSYATHTSVTIDSKICIDLSVEMPKDFFTERDFLNYRYFVKRNLYLANIYLQLVKKDKFSNVKFEFVSKYSSVYKPSLLLSYGSKLIILYLYQPRYEGLIKKI